MISFFKNRVQRYAFLRTQPNKMHKNSQNVHTSTVLCNTRECDFTSESALLSCDCLMALLRSGASSRREANALIGVHRSPHRTRR